MKQKQTILFFIGNLFFWVLSSIALYSIFTLEYKVGKADIVYTILFHIPLFVVVFLNYRAHFLLRKNVFLPYVLVFFLLIGLGVGLHYLLFDHVLAIIDVGYYFITYYTPWQIVQFNFVHLLASLLLFLALHWFELKDKQLVLEKENNRVRLRALQAQVNPHFLINSLNNIYALQKSNQGKSNDYLVQLSNAMRYMAYETSEEKVLLEKELEYIKNYVSLEKLRLESDTNVDFEIKGAYEGYVIAPFILLSFIENTFKHFSRDNPMIRILIDVAGGRLKLETTNSINPPDIAKSGIGQSNAKERLELIYPNKHHLDIQKLDKYYSVKLELDLS